MFAKEPFYYPFFFFFSRNSSHHQTIPFCVYTRFAKNRAVSQSSGEFLCFLDADDVMAPRRLEAQLAEARLPAQNHRSDNQEDAAAADDNPYVLIGSRFHRIPEGSTARYTQWANVIPHHLLDVQVRPKEITQYIVCSAN